MRVRRSATLVSLVVVLVVGSLELIGIAGAAPENSGRPLSAVLLGASEVPGPGDADGSGSASIRLNPGQGTVCYDLSVTGIDPATAAHIHEGAVDAAGPVVVGLTPPTDGSSDGCINVGRALVKEIIQDPGDYYVNVHNVEFPGGALRGQLGK